MALVKTNVPGYLMDRDTGVVINSNRTELDSYRKQVAQFREFNDLKEDFESMKRLLDELRAHIIKT